MSWLHWYCWCEKLCDGDGDGDGDCGDGGGDGDGGDDDDDDDEDDDVDNFDSSMQKRSNCSANALELHLLH